MSNKQRHILFFLAFLAPAAAFAAEFDGSVAQTATPPGRSEPQQEATPTLDQNPAVTPCPEIVALQNPNLSADELANLVNSQLFRISYEMHKLQHQISQAINPAQKAQLMKEFTALKNLELEIVETYQTQMRLKVGNVRVRRPISTSAFNQLSIWQKLAKKFKSLSRKAKLATTLTPIGILLAAIAAASGLIAKKRHLDRVALNARIVEIKATLSQTDQTHPNINKIASLEAAYSLDKSQVNRLVRKANRLDAFLSFVQQHNPNTRIIRNALNNFVTLTPCRKCQTKKGSDYDAMPCCGHVYCKPCLRNESAPTKQTHYELLGITNKATKDVIEKAFRTLAPQYHPDKNPDNKAAVEQFQLIVNAKEVLLNPRQRSRYDWQLFWDQAQGIMQCPGCQDTVLRPSS